MTNIRFSTATILALGFALNSQLHALPVASAGTSHRSAAPVMPHTFDKATVQNLIDNITISGNAPILKVGYFNVRKPQALPLKDGYELLTQAVKKETIGTKRWFLLQQVRAWGGVRLDPETRHRGLQIYSDLFRKAVLAKQNKADDVLLRTVYEYVQAVPTNHLAQSGYETILINQVLKQSLKLYLDALVNNERVVFVPDWKGALSASASMFSKEDFKPFVKMADAAAKKAIGSNRKRVLETRAAVHSVMQ